MPMRMRAKHSATPKNRRRHSDGAKPALTMRFNALAAPDNAADSGRPDPPAIAHTPDEI